MQHRVRTSERSARTTARTRARASFSRPAVARSLKRSRRSSASAAVCGRQRRYRCRRQRYGRSPVSFTCQTCSRCMGEMRAECSTAQEAWGPCHVDAETRHHVPAVAESRPNSGPSASSLSDSLLITSGAARRGRRHPCRTRSFCQDLRRLFYVCRLWPSRNAASHTIR